MTEGTPAAFTQEQLNEKLREVDTELKMSAKVCLP
jgi:hypothetical protein